jgi:hypothetical protein
VIFQLVAINLEAGDFFFDQELIISLPEHGSDVGTLEHNDDAKMPGFSVLLENAIVDANPLNSLIGVHIITNRRRSKIIAVSVM